MEGRGGDDYLEGGIGNDSYIYATGDGFDTLYDRDGLGTLSYDGVTLDGGHSIGDGLYASLDGQTIYRFADRGDGIGPLLIKIELDHFFDSDGLAVFFGPLLQGIIVT